jgi:hypothetical protein
MSAADIEAFSARVWVNDEGIVFFEEVPVMTVFGVDAEWDRFEELTAGRDHINYIVDLTQTQRPTAEVRAALKRRIARVKARLGYGALVIGDNVLMRAAARLISFSIGIGPMSMHMTREEAVNEVRRVIGH